MSRVPTSGRELKEDPERNLLFYYHMPRVYRNSKKPMQSSFLIRPQKGSSLGFVWDLFK